jgi:RHS repeat-associated protein
MSSTTAQARPVEGVPCAHTGATYARGELQGHNGGLLYAQQRWLDPSTARFLSLDPLAGSLSDPLSTQGFTYAHANPTRFTDPDGRAVNFAAAGVLGVIGAAAGCAVGAWNATDDDGWSECGKGAVAGGAAGVVAGLTFGVGAAVVGSTAAATTGATVTVGAVTATTGQIAAVTTTAVVGGALSGAVGGGTSAALHGEDALEGAAKGAGYGAGAAVIGGIAAGGAAIAGAPAAVVAVVGAVVGDAATQGAQIALGEREEFSFFEVGVAGIAGYAGAKATRPGSKVLEPDDVLPPETRQLASGDRPVPPARQLTRPSDVGPELPNYRKSVWERVSPSRLLGRQLQSEMSNSKRDRYAKKMRSSGWDESKDPIDVAEVNGKLIILDGHHRARAAQKARLPSVPIRRTDVTPEQGQQLLNEVSEAAAEASNRNRY